MMKSNTLTILMTLFIYSEAVVTNTERITSKQSLRWNISMTNTIENTIEQQTKFNDYLLKQFEEFMLKYGRIYSSAAEKLLRFDVFKDNLKVIERLNAEAKGDARFGLTPFTDLTHDGFKAMYLIPGDSMQEDLLTRRDPKPQPNPNPPPPSPKRVAQPNPPPPSPTGVVQQLPQLSPSLVVPPSPRPSSPTRVIQPSPLPPSATTAAQPGPRPSSPTQVVQPGPRPPSPSRVIQHTPDAGPSETRKRPGSPVNPASDPKAPRVVTYPPRFDWRDGSRAYPPCEYMRGCNACYAFTTAGALEIIISKHTGELIRFSKQQILDCSTNDKCNGGRINEAFDYIQQVGLFHESEYPYLGVNSTCKDQKDKPKQRIAYHIISEEAESILKGLPFCPVIVGLNARFQEMQHYRGGVLSPANCPPDQFNHAVVVIGYGLAPPEGDKPARWYWICRNSWGPIWGDQGHFNIEMGLCGIGRWVFVFKVELPRPASPNLYDLPDTLGPQPH